MRRLGTIHISSTLLSNRGRVSTYLVLTFLFVLYLGTIVPAATLKERYADLRTASWRDRTGVPLDVSPNAKGHFTASPEPIPPRFEILLLRKEDRYFYYHFGVNPVSLIRGFLTWIRSGGRVAGSSTITEQLVKILLEHERKRNVQNKLTESFYAVALELHSSKRDILSMYENVAYFGKNRQGVTEAARYFFGKAPLELTEPEMLALIASLNAPSENPPGSRGNASRLALVAETVGSTAMVATSTGHEAATALSPVTPFELKTLNLPCDPCDLTIDAALTERIREALRRRIAAASKANIHNGAVVVLKVPENELLALVGSPDPKAAAQGAQINMALSPRPIGSTIKPFIYLNAFQKGARPYTLVDDREYGYTIGTGFAFYPKNFDGKFRGTVALHEALSNSLNVPSVKVLEYVGLPRFYTFLEEALGFVPVQPLERYELGIALGALEMDLLTLAHFFSIFPNEGMLRPLTLERARPGTFMAPMEKELMQERRVANASYVQLVNKILSDREAAIPQFGLRSSLTLPYTNYALKTGTSRDYHDSWVLGFTLDFLVGVWLGNSDNTPMREVTGQSGAGAVFEDVMTLLYASPYNRNTLFSFSRLKEYAESGTIEYGLPGDNYEAARNILLQSPLILSPHEGDTILLSTDTVVPLKASETVDWLIDGVFSSRAKEANFTPQKTGSVMIEARGVSRAELVHIFVSPEQ